MLDLEPVRGRRAPDGDDYTFAHGATQRPIGAPGAVRGYSAVDDWALRSGYDCRTPAERTDAELAALRADLDRLAETVRLTTGPVDVALTVDELRDALAYLTNRVTTLEAATTAHRTALEHQADALQGIVLRGAQ